jgi:hypothetical protein
MSDFFNNSPTLIAVEVGVEAFGRAWEEYLAIKGVL